MGIDEFKSTNRGGGLVSRRITVATTPGLKTDLVILSWRG